MYVPPGQVLGGLADQNVEEIEEAVVGLHHDPSVAPGLRGWCQPEWPKILYLLSCEFRQFFVDSFARIWLSHLWKFMLGFST